MKNSNIKKSYILFLMMVVMIFSTSIKTNSYTIPTTYEDPIFEMRGCWVSTVYSIDFKISNNVESYKRQYVSVLDTLESFNMNTIFFQIRPTNDAFYKSSYNPWSNYLFGSQGTTVDLKFDPLTWMIEVTHERNMYFQGWLNAYRVTAGSINNTGKNINTLSADAVTSLVENQLSKLDNKNFAKKYPDYVLVGGQEGEEKIILNPGEPAVIKHIIDTVKEIVTNYDIDGVHFDDYFYLPNGGRDSGSFVSSYNDTNTYNEYKQDGETLGAFRRRKVNEMIQGCSEAVHKVAEAKGRIIEFGSKPAAVWKNEGVFSYSFSSYNDIYADTKLWVESGWVDYVAPQAYYNINNTEAPYTEIVDWWVNVVKNHNATSSKKVKLYIAHGIYKYDTTEIASDSNSATYFWDPYEMVNQLKYNQKYSTITGNAVFAYNDLLQTYPDTLVEGIKLFKDLWCKKTLAFEGTSTTTLVTDFNLININNQKKCSIKYNENAKAYIIYKDNKFLNIIYNHESLIFDYDSQSDYYLYVVDNNNNVSKTKVTLNKTDVKSNQAPIISSITNIKVFTKVGASGTITVEFMDPENQNLDISAYYLLDNKKISISSSSMVISKNKVVISYNIRTADIGYIVVVVSDGEFEVDIKTNLFTTNSWSNYIFEYISSEQEKLISDIFIK